MTALDKFGPDKRTLAFLELLSEPKKGRETEFYLAQTRTVLTPRIMGVAR